MNENAHITEHSTICLISKAYLYPLCIQYVSFVHHVLFQMWNLFIMNEAS